MKNVLIIIFLIFNTIVSATDYYISSSGNDTNNGLTSITPWKTIAKVNSAFSIMKPGDRILFNRGDTFYGTITIAKSGTSGSPIAISAYGTGADPIITGFTTVTGWTQVGSTNVYDKTITVESAPNMVTVDGVNTPMGRWPNTGYNSIDSHTTNTVIVDAALPASPDWDGAEVVIRKTHWTLDRSVITNHTGNSITYTSATSYDAINGYGYFIQNDLETLDAANEWYYDPSDTRLYIYSDPATKTVKVAALDSLVYISGKNYITFDNIKFTGANDAFYIRASTNIIIQNCEISYIGRMAINGFDGYPHNSTGAENLIVTNNIINQANDCAIILGGKFQGAVISYNTISNIAMIAGMSGINENSTYRGLYIGCDGVLIEYNVIYNIGYIPVIFGASNVTVDHNYIYNFCSIKDDGGGIYSQGSISTGAEITENIVINGIGASEGTTESKGQAIGIYLDDEVTDALVDGNTTAQCDYGMTIHNSHKITITNNTLFDHNIDQIYLVHDVGRPDDPLRNITMNNNIFFAKNAGADDNLLSFRTNHDQADIAAFGTASNNYYCRPLNDDIANTFCIATSWGEEEKTLAGWQTYTGQDLNSYKSNISVADTSLIDFYYNATKTNKVITLDQPMIDVKGIKYVNSITLLPFSSMVLMVDPIPDQPVIPVYMGSTIEKTTPAVLEMIYDVTLVSSVPAASAFAVSVNSVARTVNTVVVSGTKVILTLASAVIYGDVVTVAYTKPFANPLQTTSGGYAASISAQTVTNNVSPFSPVYVSSAIEDVTPAVLEMTYNLSLASIVPAAAAFTVRVNTVARTVNTVAVSGTKVMLTLASAVVSGDVVTVAYTKPSNNPLQTTSGGQAAVIIAQKVTNNCSEITRLNEPPILMIKNETSSYSGFVGEIDASGSYDLNNDILTYEWTVPQNISVSSTSSSKIQYLSPVLNTAQNLEFQLKVTDGKAIVSRNISIKIMPYKPGLNEAKISNIEASFYTIPDYPDNIADGIEKTKWSVNGDNQWLELELAEPFNISHFEIAFLRGQKYESYFDIFASKDNLIWEPILSKTASCSFSGDFQVFEIPSIKSNIEYSYIKLVGHGNSLNTLNSFSEFKTFGLLGQITGSIDTKARKINIYPNPARDFFNISIEDPTLTSQTMKIIDLSGKIVFTDHIEQGIKNVQIPENLKTGIYIVTLESTRFIIYAQKLIVNK